MGDSAPFFLEDWKPGGVEITPTVVGLFDVPVSRSRREGFAKQLYDYGLHMGRLQFMDMMRIGWSDVWSWRGAGWPEEKEIHKRASNRISRLLATDFRRDSRAQKSLLQFMQAARRQLGPPLVLDGEYRRAGGQSQRVLIYKDGVIAYDRTPHPQPLLEEVAGLLRPDPSDGGLDLPDATSQAPTP